jgi:hypothetical protein
MAFARVCWVPQEGGREVASIARRYVTVARFDEDKTWPHEAWSLVLDFVEAPIGSRCVTADVHFLVPEAPVHLLKNGSKFELLEGRTCVAKGEIVATQRKVSDSLTA